MYSFYSASGLKRKDAVDVDAKFAVDFRLRIFGASWSGSADNE
jgi:hypothetical protein